MVNFSNILIGLLNLVLLLVSIPVVVVLLWYNSHPSIPEGKFLFYPLLVIALFIMVHALLGLFGACCRISFFLWIYLFITFLLILAISGFLIFGFVVTNRGIGDLVSGKGFMEYRLGNYTGWLQGVVNDENKWREVTAYLGEVHTCSATNQGAPVSAAEFFKKNLTPLQDGCCKPPTSCGYISVNSTYWTVPKSGPASEDRDCKTWNNEQWKLCYGCDSCKAGLLQYIRNEWRRGSVVIGAFLGFLIIVYTLGCCALRNNRAEKYHRYRGYH